MMKRSAITEQLQQMLPMLRHEYGVASLSLFGSYARGEEQMNSDLDLLVTFYEVPGLLQFVALEDKLSDALGIKVDLVMRDVLKPAIGEVILREAVPV